MRNTAPLDLPTGPSLEIWDELAVEGKRYAELLDAWKAADAQERERLGDELYGSLAHLQMHSKVMMETIDTASELADDLDDLEEQKAREHAAAH